MSELEKLKKGSDDDELLPLEVKSEREDPPTRVDDPRQIDWERPSLVDKERALSRSQRLHLFFKNALASLGGGIGAVWGSRFLLVIVAMMVGCGLFTLDLYRGNLLFALLHLMVVAALGRVVHLQYVASHRKKIPGKPAVTEEDSDLDKFTYQRG